MLYEPIRKANDFVMLCLPSSYTVQFSFHFDEFFSRETFSFFKFTLDLGIIFDMSITSRLSSDLVWSTLWMVLLAKTKIIRRFEAIKCVTGWGGIRQRIRVKIGLSAANLAFINCVVPNAVAILKLSNFHWTEQISFRCFETFQSPQNFQKFCSWK